VGGNPEVAGEPCGLILRPPWQALVVGAITAAIALAVLPWTAAPMHWTGYISGMILTSLAVAAFRRIDTRRSASPYYSRVSWFNWLALGILLVGAGAGIVHIYYLSQRVA